MSIHDPAPDPWPGRMLSVLRIVAGLVFLSAGTTIVFGYPPQPVAMHFDPLSQTGVGGLLELVGGFAIMIGAFTRPVAFVLSGEMAVAYFQFHFPHSVFPTVNNGMPAVLFSFLFFYLVFAGAGPWSVDAMLATSRRAVSPAIPARESVVERG
jgi:putative oxidoreductase